MHPVRFRSSLAGETVAKPQKTRSVFPSPLRETFAKLHVILNEVKDPNGFEQPPGSNRLHYRTLDSHLRGNDGFLQRSPPWERIQSLRSTRLRVRGTSSIQPIPSPTRRTDPCPEAINTEFCNSLVGEGGTHCASRGFLYGPFMETSLTCLSEVHSHHTIPRRVASATASLIASIMLVACATPCPAMSNAVPWSTEVRMKGIPKFTDTDSSKPCTLIAMWP